MYMCKSSLKQVVHSYLLGISAQMRTLKSSIDCADMVLAGRAFQSLDCRWEEGALVGVDRAIVWKESLLVTSSRYSCRCQVLVSRDLYEVIDDAIHHNSLVLLPS